MQGEGKQQPADNQGFYQQDDPDFNDMPVSQTTDESVDWLASEYIHHDKGALWLVGLITVTLVIIGLAIWAGQWIFAGLAVLMAITFGVFAFRKPRDVQYHLGSDGLRINSTTYVFNDFKSFGIVEDGAFYSAVLIPTKRFMPATTIYFAPSEGERIVDILGNHLPMQQVQIDWFDTFMRKLRF